ncbi:hypothetical protein SH661x_004102 [Planctomicrobium sp. SH661]|uniref:hypothetical protein n=1 Tax=Planctomicrobium sp. SH661 TaxID=3448124 RepID=UPI003F5B5CCA
MMRLPFSSSLMRILPLLLLLASSGCEVGHQWFSMSSDSPMPWFGFDLMPRRRTSQVLPDHRDGIDATREVATKARSQDQRERPRSERVWSKELHLPSIPAYFNGEEEVELSFNGPSGPFSK